MFTGGEEMHHNPHKEKWKKTASFNSPHMRAQQIYRLFTYCET